MVDTGTLSIYIVTAWIRALIQWYGFGVIKRRLISSITESKNSVVLVFSTARGSISSIGPSYSKPSILAMSIGEGG